MMHEEHFELCTELFPVTLDRARSSAIIGTLRYQDGELRRGRHCKSKTGTSPVVAAKNKILKIVYFCVGRRRRYFSLYNSNDIL